MAADPHEAPNDESPGERRLRLMNLNNEGWKPAKAEPKVDEIPVPTAEGPIKPAGFAPATPQPGPPEAGKSK